ncbi:MAG TPA: hypothetical protein VHF45_05965 [Thermoleophilaceae bacterium]|nr:hypothetical protein [Thermoleophilaceae bacterium]
MQAGLKTLENGMLSLGLFLSVIMAFFVVGRTYEVTTYPETTAQVVGVEHKCEMSYKTGRRSTTERIVDCRDVASVKARIPEVDWRVADVTFATLLFTTATGDTVRTSVRVGTIERTNVTAGERIAILYSPEKPTNIRVPFQLSELTRALPFGVAGLALLFLWHWLRRWRLGRQERALHAHALALAEQMVQSRVVGATAAAVRTASPPVERGFGRRAA